MITTDTFIEIGSQHKICEDYIISGDNYIILSDGCSRSENSDMGARILCYMAQQYMKHHQMYPTRPDFQEKLGSWIIHNAEVTARHLGLKTSCLDATLMIAYVIDDYIRIHMFGDGYVILKLKESPLLYEIFWVEYEKNMPYYLRYLIDEHGQRVYHNEKISKSLVNTSVFRRGDVSERGVLDQYAYDHPDYFCYHQDSFESITICSDGLGSFLDPMGPPNSNKLIGVQHLIDGMLQFKVTKGDFLKRRMNRYSKELKKENIQHYDDLSVGTFLIEDETNGEDD